MKSPLTNGQILAADADKARAKGKNANLDKTMARLMLRAGRLTDEARVYVQDYCK